MKEIIIFIGLIFGLNCIPLLTKTTFPRLEKVVVSVLITATIFFITLTIFEFNGYRLKGYYTFPIVIVTLLVSVVLYFILFKNTRKKLLTIFPLTLLFLFGLFMLFLGRPIYEIQIDNKNKLSVTKGGLMACGEIYHITQSRFLIFDKEVFHITNLCLFGTTKIETIKLDNNQAEFLIYHNGKNDSENPYNLKIERKNSW